MIGPFDLPWPSSSLSQNARVHWSKRAHAARIARGAAFYIAHQAAGREKLSWEGAKLTLVYHPPDKRRYDADGLISRSKAQIDGIADAIGIDDRHFTFTFSIGEPVKYGKVRVTIEPCPYPIEKRKEAQK